jgi:hypothetical protein
VKDSAGGLSLIGDGFQDGLADRILGRTKFKPTFLAILLFKISIDLLDELLKLNFRDDVEFHFSMDFGTEFLYDVPSAVVTRIYCRVRIFGGETDFLGEIQYDVRMLWINGFHRPFRRE